MPSIKYVRCFKEHSRDVTTKSQWLIVLFSRERLFTIQSQKMLLRSIMSYETPKVSSIFHKIVVIRFMLKVVTVHNPQIGLLRNCCQLFKTFLINQKSLLEIKRQSLSLFKVRTTSRNVFVGDNIFRRILQVLVVLYVTLYQLWYAQEDSFFILIIIFS